MKAPRKSLKNQLLLWLSIPMLILLVFQSVLTYGISMNLATDAFDKGLLDTVFSIYTCIDYKNNKVEANIPPVALAILKENIKDQIYYRIEDQDGNFIAGDPNLPKPVISAHKKIGIKSAKFSHCIIKKNQARLVQVIFEIKGIKDKFVIIQVAETLASRNQVADKILLSIVLPQLFILIMFLLIVRIGVEQGLIPLEAIRKAVSDRSAFDLRPVTEKGTPQEVKPLIKAINNLLQQLQNDIDTQKRFVANAAHQLRTPIAGLKTQVELALRIVKDQELEHHLTLIKVSALRASRLINQLLSLAKADPLALNISDFSILDLSTVVTEVCKELAPQAINKNIDFGFDDFSKPLKIKANKIAIHELINNLVENAILYTPTGGKISISLNYIPNSIDSRNIILSIEDTGPGIPLEEREKVFERFYRLDDTNSNGSGLGLAIVREIIKAHDAKIYFESPKNNSGLVVLVKFSDKI